MNTPTRLVLLLLMSAQATGCFDEGTPSSDSDDELRRRRAVPRVETSDLSSGVAQTDAGADLARPPGTGKIIEAASASFADVSAAVAMAAPGDTVHIGVSSATWTSTLTLHAGVSIVGAGVGSTIISGSVKPLIAYAPAAANFARDDAFRVSGIEFNLLGSGQAITLACACHLPAQTGIRIDHNKFRNSSALAAGVEHTSCFGVVDHNTFEGMYNPIRAWGDSCSGYSPSTFGRWTWESFGEYSYGTSNVMYIEDNTLTLNASHYMVSDGDQGCSYVFRYNTIDTGGDIYPAFDFHGGGQRGNLWGCRGGEIYGNKITGSGFLVSQRGGRISVHHNTLSGGGSVNIYDNDSSPIQGVAPYVVAQRISDSYHFLTRRSETGSLVSWSSSGGDDNGMVVQNATFWMDNASCEAPSTCANLSAGIGCGTLANRPTSCTTGTGYWATTQSCSDLTGMVGANPASPIAGTLYRCTAGNVWQPYYTPLSYPHPLVTP